MKLLLRPPQNGRRFTSRVASTTQKCSKKSKRIKESFLICAVGEQFLEEVASKQGLQGQAQL